MGGEASFAQYEVSPGGGAVRIDLSRESFCGKDVRSRVLIRLGPVGISDSGQPMIREVTQERRAILHSCQRLEFTLPTPTVPWRTEVTIDPTFAPSELDPRLSDPRQLGARVTFTVVNA